MKEKERDQLFNILKMNSFPSTIEGINIYKDFLLTSISKFQADLPQLWEELTSLFITGFRLMEPAMIIEMMNTFMSRCRNMQIQIPQWITRVIEDDKKDNALGIAQNLKKMENIFAFNKKLLDQVKLTPQDQIDEQLRKNYLKIMKNLFPNIDNIKTPEDIDENLILDAFGLDKTKSKAYMERIKQEKEKDGLIKYDGRSVVDTICDFYESYRYINGLLLIFLDITHGETKIETQEYFDPKRNCYGEMYKYKFSIPAEWRKDLQDLQSYLSDSYPIISKFMKYFMDQTEIRNISSHHSLDVDQDRLKEGKWAMYNSKSKNPSYRKIDSLVQLSQDQYYFYVFVTHALSSSLQKFQNESSEGLDQHLTQTKELVALIGDWKNFLSDENEVSRLCGKLENMITEMHNLKTSCDHEWTAHPLLKPENEREIKNTIRTCSQIAHEYQQIIVLEKMVGNRKKMEKIFGNLADSQVFSTFSDSFDHLDPTSITALKSEWQVKLEKARNQLLIIMKALKVDFQDI